MYRLEKFGCVISFEAFAECNHTWMYGFPRLQIYQCSGITSIVGSHFPPRFTFSNGRYFYIFVAKILDETLRTHHSTHVFQNHLRIYAGLPPSPHHSMLCRAARHFGSHFSTLTILILGMGGSVWKDILVKNPQFSHVYVSVVDSFVQDCSACVN